MMPSAEAWLAMFAGDVIGVVSCSGEDRVDKHGAMREIDILTGRPMRGGRTEPEASGAAVVATDLDASCGEPLFVINLCAAMTPLHLDRPALPGLEQYKLYQVSRLEDGRRRYRLRLGFFTSESAAEEVLASVRSQYATAFTTCLCEEDVKPASNHLKRSPDEIPFQKTGRFAVAELRRKLDATGSMPALDSENRPAKQPPAAASRPTATRAQTPERAPAPRESAGIATPAPMTISEAIASLGPNTTPAPKRESLMRRAHAMAPVDAAERAKAVPAQRHFDNDDFATPAASAKPLTSKPTPKPQAPANRQIEQTAPPVPQPKSAIGGRPDRQADHQEWELITPPVQQSNARIQNSNLPFHVGAGAQIPATNLTLDASDAAPAQTVLDAAAKKVGKTSISPIVETQTTSDLMRARELARQSAQWRQDYTGVPTLDTTQTIRTLTAVELADANHDKWFAVQLALSDQPANLDTMPHLDIFEAYTLYSVATMDGDKIRHALRLGFFSEEVSAEAVTGYLKTFFTDPSILRIPDAEHERFADAPKIIAPIKPAASVVTLEEKRPFINTRTPADANAKIPTVNAAVDGSYGAGKKSAPNVGGRAQPMPRSTGVAVRSTAVNNKTAKKSNGHTKPQASHQQREMLKEAKMLGLSDTQILRVQKNPSLLARLVDKFAK